METNKKEEQGWRMMQLPNCSGWSRLRLVMETEEERKARLEKMVAMTTQLR